MRLVIAGAGSLMLAMVVLLVMQLAILRDSREHIVAQDRKINRIVKGADPVLDDLEPALDDLGPVLDDLGPALDQVGPAAVQARRTLRQAEPLMRDLVPLADLGTQLVRGLRDSEFIPRTLRAADVVPEMAAILHATLAVQRETLSTQLRSLRVNRKSRRTQRATLAILRRSLAIQEEALVHVRSIDRKTGGPAPGTPAPLPAP